MRSVNIVEYGNSMEIALDIMCEEEQYFLPVSLKNDKNVKLEVHRTAMKRIRMK